MPIKVKYGCARESMYYIKKMLTPYCSHCTLLQVSALKGQSSESIGTLCEQGHQNACPDVNITLDPCFSAFVRKRPGKFFFHKTRARSQQIYS